MNRCWWETFEGQQRPVQLQPEEHEPGAGQWPPVQGGDQSGDAASRPGDWVPGGHGGGQHSVRCAANITHSDVIFKVWRSVGARLPVWPREAVLWGNQSSQVLGNVQEVSTETKYINKHFYQETFIKSFLFCFQEPNVGSRNSLQEGRWSQVFWNHEKR